MSGLLTTKEEPLAAPCAVSTDALIAGLSSRNGRTDNWTRKHLACIAESAISARDRWDQRRHGAARDHSGEACVRRQTED